MAVVSVGGILLGLFRASTPARPRPAPPLASPPVRWLAGPPRSSRAVGLSREEAMRVLAELQEMDQRLRDLRESLTALLERASPDAKRQ
jgi:hypothetical protein